MDWPLREALLCYLFLLRKEARERYEAEVATWAALAPHSKRSKKPPQLPAILKEKHANT